MSMGEKSREPGATSHGSTGAVAPPEPSTGIAGSAAAGREPRGLDVARDSDVPISTQLYWQLAYQVDTGRLHPGARLPTVRELGAMLRVNPNTVRAVYRRLAEAGYVVSRHGAGTRVAARPPVRRTRSCRPSTARSIARSPCPTHARRGAPRGADNAGWSRRPFAQQQSACSGRTAVAGTAAPSWDFRAYSGRGGAGRITRR